MSTLKILFAAGATALSVIAWEPSASADVDPPSAPEDMINLRDPFRRPNVDAEFARPRSELETFPADQLRMVGVLTGPIRLKAMILAPNGKTYFVTLNTRVGLRSGVIAKITEDMILIREKVVNLVGQQEDLETVLQMVAEHRVSASGMGPGQAAMARQTNKVEQTNPGQGQRPPPPGIGSGNH